MVLSEVNGGFFTFVGGIDLHFPSGETSGKGGIVKFDKATFDSRVAAEPVIGDIGQVVGIGIPVGHEILPDGNFGNLFAPHFQSSVE